MKLTQEEKNKLISSKDESEWYAICEEIKTRRNNIYPNELAREIVKIYHNKFPVNKYPVWEEVKLELMSRKSFLSWLSIGWMAFAAATGGFLAAALNVLTFKILIRVKTER